MLIKSKGNKDKKTWIHPSRKKVLDVLYGNDTTQTTFGYEGEVKTKREVGDRWTDADGKEWEQCDGFKMRVTKLDEVRAYMDEINTCRASDCGLIGKAKGANARFIKQTGFCVNCLVKREAQMREAGLYETYEFWKMNTMSLIKLKDDLVAFEAARHDIEIVPTFVNENGSIERWDLPANIEEIKADMDKDIANLKELITNFQTAVDEDWEIIKEKYNEIFND